MPDNGGAPTCNDDSATTWPPLVADGAPTVGDGLDLALFSSATRDDGDDQVTVDGWPLYFFSGDTTAGDTNGQGVGGIWYVVGPDGAAIGAGRVGRAQVIPTPTDRFGSAFAVDVP